MKLKTYSLLLIIFVAFSCKGQKDIYIFSYRYSKDITELNKSTSYNLKPVKMLGQYMIDPSRKGNIDYNLVSRYLNELYPDIYEKGLLTINLEGALFSKLRDEDLESEAFKNAEKEYIKLIQFVKNKVPFVKVGVYGLPFKGYYESQLIKNERGRLNKVLKEVDVLMPSLYIAFPAKQKNQESNIDYLRKNLDIAFEHGERLNKSVYPFFWYLVHPNNKRYGYAFIPKNEFLSYLDFIFSYSYNSTSVKGVIWWDTPTPYKDNTVNKILLKRIVGLDNLDKAFEYYLNKN